MRKGMTSEQLQNSVLDLIEGKLVGALDLFVGDRPLIVGILGDDGVSLGDYQFMSLASDPEAAMFYKLGPETSAQRISADEIGRIILSSQAAAQ